MKVGGHEAKRNPLEARRHFAAMFAMVASILMLAACGPTLEIENIGRAEIRMAAASKAVVVGQLQIRSPAGKSIFPTRSVWSHENPPEGVSVLLVRMTDDTTTLRAVPSVNADGRFAWAIHPGTYVIDRIIGTSTIMGPRSLFDVVWVICPKTVFRVEQSAGIINLGEISIDLPSSGSEEGQSKSNFCEELESDVNVTQDEGEITNLVLKTLTAVVVAPELPLLWDTSAIAINASNVAEAKEILRRHGVTISGQSVADGL